MEHKQVQSAECRVQSKDGGALLLRNYAETDPHHVGWAYSPTFMESHSSIKTVGEYAHPTKCGMNPAPLLWAIALLVLSMLATTTSAAEPTVMTTKDGRIQVQLPDGYTEQSPIKKEISLQAVNESKDATIFIISEHQKDFDSLQGYAEIVRGLMLDKLQDGQSDAGEKLELGGNPAIRYEITGLSKGFRLAYQLTVIQTETRFNQVLASTTRKQFADCKEEFEKVAKSLKELPERPSQEKK
jgi:hypothetical protein